MLVVTAIIRTEVLTQKLPPLVSSMFPNVTVTHGKLASPNGVVIPEPWKIMELNAILNGRTTQVEYFPDSLLVVDPAGKLRSSLLFTADSVHLLGKIDKANTPSYGFSTSWGKITRGLYDIDFSQHIIAKNLTEKKLQLFVSMLFSTAVQFIADLLNLWLLLFLIILIYRRELSQVWQKKSTFKILLNGTIPYFILMPVFAVSGDHAEFLVTTAAVISTIMISRAFRFHRISLFLASKKDE